MWKWIFLSDTSLSPGVEMDFSLTGFSPWCGNGFFSHTGLSPGVEMDFSLRQVLVPGVQVFLNLTQV